MVPWIQVYSNLITHPKTYKLADLLGIKSQQVRPNVIAGGLMVSIWLWAAQSATDGDLSRVTAQCLADAAGYTKSAKPFLEALIASGFVDRDEDGALRLHDWLEYASLLAEQDDNRRNKTKERVQRYRDRKNAEAIADGM